MLSSHFPTCETVVVADVAGGHELVGEQRLADLGGPEHEDGEPGHAEARVSAGAGVVVLRRRAQTRPAGVGVAEAARGWGRERREGWGSPSVRLAVDMQDAAVILAFWNS